MINQGLTMYRYIMRQPTKIYTVNTLYIFGVYDIWWQLLFEQVGVDLN